MPVFNGYRYEPLSARGAIRLLVLHPASDYQAPLSCRIVEHQHSLQHRVYSAVSYAWGLHQFGRNLEVQHDNGDVSYLRITPTVDALLRHFRKPNKSRHLWIDAICLNQEDEVEKARQIPEMGTIYKMAIEVEVWLGPAIPQTAKLFRFFQELSQVPDVRQWVSQWDMAGWIFYLMRKNIHPNTGEAMGIITKFLEQPWFSRRWVIQEACLARRAIVHCGEHLIPLPVLSIAAKRFQRLDMSDYAIRMMADLAGTTIQQSSMLELLWYFHEAECCDPKDRIAALLSLIPDSQRFPLDYKKPWTDSFEEFACFTYTRGDNDVRLQLLLHLFEFGPVQRQGQTVAAYSSWVPDWTRSRRRNLPYLNYPKNPDTYETYPFSPGDEKAALTFHSGYLQVHWDVSWTALPPEYQVTSSTWMDSHSEKCECGAEAERVLQRLFPSVSESVQRILALASLLKVVSDFRHPVATREMTSRPLAEFEAQLRQCHPNLDYEEILTWLRTLDSALKPFSLVEFESIGRKNPGSASQNYGIGPGQMKTGDIIIPLWSHRGLCYQPVSHASAREEATPTTVMLAVRRVVSERRKSSEDDPGGVTVRTARIIGPVVTVTRYTENLPSGDAAPHGTQGCKPHTKRWSSMRLV